MSTGRITRRRFLLGAFGGLMVAGEAYSLRPQVLSSAPRIESILGPAPASLDAPTAAASSISQAATRGSLSIPPLLSPTETGATKAFALTMAPGQTELLPGRMTLTLGFNGGYLGPTIRVARGDAVQLGIRNQLGEPTTVHWHGMHLPPAMDGGPHQVIEPNEIWRPAWTIRQQAATLWYHPHLMGATAEQVTRGLAGMFILDDDNPAQQVLPHRYGVDDLPLILQDEVIDADDQLAIRGRGRGGGATAVTLVNGSISPWLETPAQRVRLRILNASRRSFYALGLGDDQTFFQVGSDGGLLPTPVPMTRLQLGPAERAELVVDLSPDQATTLQARSSGFGFGGRGAGNQPVDLLTLLTTGEEPRPAALPSALNAVERLDPDRVDVARDMVLARAGRGFVINGESMRTNDDMMHMDSAFRVQVGDTELWRVINNSGATHLFHVHDVEFQIVDRNGDPPPAHEMGWKDTVMVRPNETVRIMMSFADYGDFEHPYMFHCHILDHEDGGMMGQFLVVPRTGDPPSHAGMTM